MSDDVPREAGPRLCPHCGATMAPDQDWCLECGTAATTRVVPAPSWKVPVAAIVAVLVAFAIAMVIAVSVLSGDAERSVSPVDEGASAAQASEPGTTTPAETQPREDVAAAATGATGATGDEAEKETGATGATGETGTSGATSGDVALWDDAKEAYTVVLVTSDREGAEKVAKETAKSSGAQTGVLDTSKYEFFSPDLWIAWAGEFDDKPDAQKLQAEIAKDGRRGYVTLVKKK